MFVMAEKIADPLGTTGMNVITRVFGLIILSIAAEFITKELAAVFPIPRQLVWYLNLICPTSFMPHHWLQ